MTINSLWPVLVVAAAQAALTFHRMLAYLRYFQQDGYDALRFARWVKGRSLTDPALFAALGTFVLAPTTPAGATFGFAAVAAVLIAVQPDPQRSGKIRLNLTSRAKRVLALALVLTAVLWIVIAAIGGDRLQSSLAASAATLVVLPALLAVSNLLLSPLEQELQNRYRLDAQQRVRAINPFVVGITGSYGKSSAKSMLGHILRTKAPTLAASGSINTLMGVTRHIRDELVFGHEFMVVEMGAYQVGSIRKLCELTPPSAALITAVGEMHLERFGSKEAIVKAKGELADALPPGGVLVVNADSPGALAIAQRAVHCRVSLYGESPRPGLATRVANMTFSRKGTTFTLETASGPVSCFTPLLGRPIILNLAGAFTLAEAVGVDRAVIVAALRTLKPVPNRLEVVEDNGVTWIRDAFNSNPIGFRAALEVAAALPAKRRFLMTPGVIELGDEQFAANRALATDAAAVCDTTIVVADQNRDAFIRGFRDAGAETSLVALDTREQAFAYLRERQQEGDLVILENDLPDLHEETSGLFFRTKRRAAKSGGQR